MARWILKHNRISTCILVLLFFLQQVIIRYTSDMMDVLVTSIFMMLVLGTGIYLCKYKLAQCDKACR